MTFDITYIILKEIINSLIVYVQTLKDLAPKSQNKKLSDVILNLENTLEILS
jgi:hypothetical protein